MAKKKIFSIGYTFPGGVVDQIDYDSDQTLLDADIIVFQPSIEPLSFSITERFEGKPLLYESSSFRAKEVTAHWRRELKAAFDAGKVVFIFLAKPLDLFIYTGRKEFSGTGRNQKVTNVVAPLTSYLAIPLKLVVHPARGTSVVLSNEATYLATYWKEFNNSSPYEVTIEGEFSNVLLKTKTGDRIVGAVVRSKQGGVFILLPPVEYDEEAFTEYNEENEDEVWTNEAQKFGKRLVAYLVGVADAIQSASAITPPPNWTQSPEFRFEKEDVLAKEILEKSNEIQVLQEEKLKLETDLREVGSLRRLLYETGHQLEDAILEALKLFGFNVQQFDDGKSEFDAMFSGPEGRFLGEAEGKERQAINIDKLSQLERNLQEDFAREEVTEFAKGVLFGNSYRLTPIGERPAPFTEKCLAGAKRSGIALIFTPDLFAPAKYLKEHEDPEYARQCREAIFQCSGQIVVFPLPPDFYHIVSEIEPAVIDNEITKS